MWKGEGSTVIAITNTKLVMEDGIIWDGRLVIDGDRILRVGWACEIGIPDGVQVIDAMGRYTTPGFIDIHCHGAGSANFNEDPLGNAAHFLRHGTTTVLPTLYMNLTAQQMIDGARRIMAASREGAGRIIGGLYMEGPYMGAFGSVQDGIVWNRPIDESAYRPLVDQIAPWVRVWAIDPSRENIDSFMRYVKQCNPAAIFALGHSHATAAECRRVADLGVRVQTHHGDSGKVPGRAQGTVGAGCDEFTLYNPDMYAELICDEVGVHVVPDMIKMVVRTKGVERMILISDSMCDKYGYKNNEAEGIVYGPDLNYDDRGWLAGSHLTLDNACRNLMAHTGYGLCHAIRFVSVNPARMLGIFDEVGSLAPGKRADLLIMDDAVHIEKVMLRGEIQ